MSRNISKLSGRKGLKDNLFKRMIDTTKRSEDGKEIKQLAEEYHVGVSTIHGGGVGGLGLDHLQIPEAAPQAAVHGVHQPAA